jgi:NADH-quinone oxidoreductase subunit H
LFLGGFHAPLPILDFIPGPFWLFAKLILLVLLFIWIRGTMPRLRADQLMEFAWKFMLPMSVMNLITTGVWISLGGGVFAWIVGAVMNTGGYFGWSRLLSRNSRIKPRVYRYAEETKATV